MIKSLLSLQRNPQAFVPRALETDFCLYQKLLGFKKNYDWPFLLACFVLPWVELYYYFWRTVEYQQKSEQSSSLLVSFGCHFFYFYVFICLLVAKIFRFRVFRALPLSLPLSLSFSCVIYSLLTNYVWYGKWGLIFFLGSQHLLRACSIVLAAMIPCFVRWVASSIAAT